MSEAILSETEQDIHHSQIQFHLELILERLRSDIELLSNFEEEFTEVLKPMYELENVLIKTVEPWNY